MIYLNYRPLILFFNFSPLLKSDTHQFSDDMSTGAYFLVLPTQYDLHLTFPSQILIEFEEPNSAKVSIMIIEV